MFNGNKILAVIPARGGSKGIPNKNIIDLCGLPLIAYSIQAAQKSQYIDNIIVSTDSLEIKRVAEQFGVAVPFLRPAHLATDNAKTIDCILDTISKLKDSNQIYDAVVLLQPTQPIRQTKAIDDAIEKLIESAYDSLVSVEPVNEHPLLMKTTASDGTLQALLNTNSTVRRQDFPPVYRVNGNIYINRINSNLHSETSLNDNQLPFFMEKNISIDIDTLDDLKHAEVYIKNTGFHI